MKSSAAIKPFGVLALSACMIFLQVLHMLQMKAMMTKQLTSNS